MKHKALGAVLALLLMVGLPIVEPDPEPAAAAQTCRTAGSSVRRASVTQTSTLYVFSNTMQLCVERNSSYQTIRSGYSWHGFSSPDWFWSFEGLAGNRQWNDYFFGLWVRHSSNKQGHFQSCILWACQNTYPYVNLYGKNDGNIYLAGKHN